MRKKTIVFLHTPILLIDLAEASSKNTFQFTPNQIVHVFTRLLEFVLLMHEAGFYYTDIKPDNIALVQTIAGHE